MTEQHFLLSIFQFLSDQILTPAIHRPADLIQLATIFEATLSVAVYLVYLANLLTSRAVIQSVSSVQIVLVTKHALIISARIHVCRMSVALGLCAELLITVHHAAVQRHLLATHSKNVI